MSQLINAGKGEALRIRAILRSLVPTSDLVGIISIPLKMPMVNKGTDYGDCLLLLAAVLILLKNTVDFQPDYKILPFDLLGFNK